MTDGTSPVSANTHEYLSVRYCNGVMGVPITFMDKFTPSQFRIIGATESEGKGFCHNISERHSCRMPNVKQERKTKKLC